MHSLGGKPLYPLSPLGSPFLPLCSAVPTHMAVHICNICTQKAELEVLFTQGQIGLGSETPSHKERKEGKTGNGGEGGNGGRDRQ